MRGRRQSAQLEEQLSAQTARISSLCRCALLVTHLAGSGTVHVPGLSKRGVEAAEPSMVQSTECTAL